MIILGQLHHRMTGHQHNPATGFTIKGEPTKQVDLVQLAKAVGVERVRVADPFEIDEFEKILREETAVAEPSVIISQRPCALLKHVKYQGPLAIDPDRCKKCKICLKIGCPAIVDHGDTVQIDAALCLGCGLCAKLCKFNAIGKAGEAND